LLFSTYLEGSSTDRASSLAIAADGSVVIYGETSSDDLPVSGNALQKTPQPRDPLLPFATDLFLARVQPRTGSIVYATYLGGPGGVQAGGLAMDQSENLYITGTVGPRFPTTAGTLSSTVNGGALVAKISRDGSRLLYSAVIGGNRPTRGVAVAVDDGGRATLAAYTNSSDMPVTPDAVERSGGGEGDLHTNAYIARLNARGDGLDYATYFGNPGFQKVHGMAIDATGAVVIVGENLGKAPRVTPNSAQSCGFANIAWAFVARIQPREPGQRGLLYASLLRGSGYAAAHSVAIGPDDRAYITGSTASDDFATLAPVVGPFHGSDTRTFIVTVDPTPASAPHVGCLAHAADLLPTPIAPGEIVSLFGSGLGPADPAQFRLDPQGRVPTSLAGVRVLFDGIAAPLLYVSSGQINAIVPAAIRGKARVTVQVETGEAVAEPFTAQVVDLAPAFFTLDGTGSGAAAALNQDGTVNTPANPARRGELVSMFGTGALWAGGTIDGEINPLVINSLPLNFEVRGMSASRPAEVLFSGPAPGQVAGVFQLNIRIPFDSSTGDHIPISASLRDTPVGHSQTIAIRE
jgi:uncharacterized protein (TIGR03437 family)